MQNQAARNQWRERPTQTQDLQALHHSVEQSVCAIQYGRDAAMVTSPVA
jgi:hypothetical protein